MKPYLLSWTSDKEFVAFAGSEIERPIMPFDTEAKVVHTLGFQTQNIYFKGSIFEQDKILKLLDLSPSCLEELLLAIIARWGKKLNQYLLGDYVLAWQDEEVICTTTSVGASHTLFWHQNNLLSISSELSHLSKLAKHKLKLNEVILQQRFSFGLMLTEDTSFNNIFQLIPGETLVWDLKEKCKIIYKKIVVKHSQNKITEKIEVTKELVEQNKENKELCNSQIFSIIPDLAYQLGEPLMDSSLVELSIYLGGLSARQKEQGVLLKTNWLKGRYCLEEDLLSASQLDRKLFTRRLKAHNRGLNRLILELHNDFEKDDINHSEKLNFIQWFDLNHAIPAWCQLLQRIAAFHDVVLINKFQNYQKTKSFVLAENRMDEKAAFNLIDPSVYNIFDSMQRLFYNGEKATKKLFKIDPVNTSRLLQKKDAVIPRRTEQTCIQLLTFDYLAKFIPYALD